MRTFNSKRSFTCSNSRHSYLCLLLLLSLKRQFFLTIFYAFDEWVRLKQRYEKNVSITVWWENFEVIHTLLLKTFCNPTISFSCWQRNNLLNISNSRKRTIRRIKLVVQVLRKDAGTKWNGYAATAQTSHDQFPHV